MIKVDEKVKNGTLTELEGKVVNWLLHHGYYAERGYSDVVAEDVSSGTDLDSKIVRGVISSLVKKGYIETDYQDDVDMNIIYAKDSLYALDDNTERWE